LSNGRHAFISFYRFYSAILKERLRKKKKSKKAKKTINQTIMLASLRTKIAASCRSLPFGTAFFSSSSRTSADVVSGSSSLFNAALQEAEQQQKALPTASSSPSSPSSPLSPASFQLRTYVFKTANFRISPWKTNIVAKTIRGMPLLKAIDQMDFNKKRPAAKIRSLLNRAAHAIEKNHKGQRENWVVKQCWVGKGKYLKRVKLHARGRFGIMHHPASHVKVLLEELPQSQWNETKQQAIERKEFEKLVHIFRRHNLYVPLPDSQPVRNSLPPWSKKPYKYVTSPKWVDPSAALVRRK
jgi:ribosomal protein L22